MPGRRAVRVLPIGLPRGGRVAVGAGRRRLALAAGGCRDVEAGGVPPVVAAGLLGKLIPGRLAAGIVTGVVATGVAARGGGAIAGATDVAAGGIPAGFVRAAVVGALAVRAGAVGPVLVRAVGGGTVGAVARPAVVRGVSALVAGHLVAGQVVADDVVTGGMAAGDVGAVAGCVLVPGPRAAERVGAGVGGTGRLARRLRVPGEVPLLRAGRGRRRPDRRRAPVLTAVPAALAPLLAAGLGRRWPRRRAGPWVRVLWGAESVFRPWRHVRAPLARWLATGRLGGRGRSHGSRLSTVGTCCVEPGRTLAPRQGGKRPLDGRLDARSARQPTHVSPADDRFAPNSTIMYPRRHAQVTIRAGCGRGCERHHRV